jgi:Rrf2 family transcriptional regulator, cysteine metabolism repressor
MRLNTKMRYGTRAMLELALRHDQGPISLREVAEVQELSEKYLEALLGTLRAAGLVSSQRGPQGGYQLTRSPEAITLRDIFEALEGPEPLVPCTLDHAYCTRRAVCAAQEVWARMYEANMRVLETTTLAALALRQSELRTHTTATYTI